MSRYPEYTNVQITEMECFGFDAEQIGWFGLGISIANETKLTMEEILKIITPAFVRSAANVIPFAGKSLSTLILSELMQGYGDQNITLFTITQEVAREAKPDVDIVCHAKYIHGLETDPDGPPLTFKKLVEQAQK